MPAKQLIGVIYTSLMILLTENGLSQKLSTEFADSLEFRASKYRYFLTDPRLANEKDAVIQTSGSKEIRASGFKKRSTIDTMAYSREKYKSDLFDALLSKRSLLGKSNLYKLDGLQKEQVEFSIKIKKENLADIIINRIAKIKAERHEDEKTILESRDSIFSEAFIRYMPDKDPAYYLILLPGQSIFSGKIYFENDTLSFRPQPGFKNKKMKDTEQGEGIEIIHNNRVIAGIDYSMFVTSSSSQTILVDEQLSPQIRNLAVSAAVIFLETMVYSNEGRW